MNTSGPHDPRLLINTKKGMDVMIVEDGTNNDQLVTCRIKRIISTDAVVELGVRVECEDGKMGRIRFIGYEAEYRTHDELLTILEKKLRNLIEQVLSNTSKDWWTDRISKIIQENVDLKNEKYRKLKKLLDVGEFSSLEQTDFIHLQWIITSKKNYPFFNNIFGKDKCAISTKLFELAHLRNINAHNKELKNLEKQKIQVYFHDINYQIERYYERT